MLTHEAKHRNKLQLSQDKINIPDHIQTDFPKEQKSVRLSGFIDQ